MLLVINTTKSLSKRKINKIDFQICRYYYYILVEPEKKKKKKKYKIYDNNFKFYIGII